MLESSARPLISVTELTEELVSDRRPALLDVRWRLGGPPGIEAYQADHLPDAVFVDLDTCLAGQAGSGAGGRHPLPESGVFEAAMRLAGLHDGQLAVVYDDVGSTIAARLWWLLRYFGHDQVAVLDGGLAAWTAAGQPVTARVPEPLPATSAPASAVACQCSMTMPPPALPGPASSSMPGQPNGTAVR